MGGQEGRTQIGDDLLSIVCEHRRQTEDPCKGALSPESSAERPELVKVI